jgi:hypothetical protein
MTFCKRAVLRHIDDFQNIAMSHGTILTVLTCFGSKSIRPLSFNLSMCP